MTVTPKTGALRSGTMGTVETRKEEASEINVYELIRTTMVQFSDPEESVMTGDSTDKADQSAVPALAPGDFGRAQAIDPEPMGVIDADAAAATARRIIAKNEALFARLS